IDVIGGRPAPEAAQDHDSLAVTGFAMTWRAVDVESLPAALEKFASQRKRNRIHQFSVGFAGVKSLVGIQMAASDRAFGKRASGASIGKKRTRFQRQVFRLVRHLLAA